MELSVIINRYPGISNFLIIPFHLFFYCVRKISNLFTNKDGNIIIITLRKLGDTVFTIPAIKEIQRKHKDKIIIICFKEVIPICKTVLSNVEYCSLEHNDFYFNGRVAIGKVRKTLRHLNPKIIYDLTGVMTSATLIFNSRAQQIIGMNRNQFRMIYDNFIPIRNTPHLIDMYLDATGIKNLNIEKRNEIKNSSTVQNRNGKILVHPFAGWRAKEFNFNKFIKIIKELNRDYNIRLVLPLGSIPSDIIKEVLNENIDVRITKSVEEIIEEIKGCSVFIGNDSGPLYIASLMGKPTFTFYGPTNHEFSIPLGKDHQYINKILSCSPTKDNQYCFTFAGMLGCPSFECMNSLMVDEIRHKLLNFIEINCNYSQV